MYSKAWLCGAILLIGCSQNYSDKKKDEAIHEQQVQAQSNQPAAPAQLPAGHPPLGAPGSEAAPGSAAMPPGHPPMGGAASAGTAIDVKAGERQSLGGLSAVLPAGWKPIAPSSSMRTAEYQLAGASGGDASLVVFYFGADQGGSVEANIDRWYGQFTQPDGKATQAHSRRWEKPVGSLKATLVDITGTYTGGGMGGGANAPQTGYRMLGAILVSPRGPFFFKLVGPAAAVDHWNKSFEQYIDSALPE